MIWSAIFFLSFGFTLGIVPPKIGDDVRGWRIYRGNDANITDFPYQVSLRLDDYHFCGGSIISERHILTAAHCILDPSVRDLYDRVTVRAGTSSIFKTGNVYQIANKVTHPKFRYKGKMLLNDVGILELAVPIKFDKYQQPINLTNEEPTNGTAAIITGWGRDQYNGIPETLQKLETILLTSKHCQSVQIDEIFSTNVCAHRRVGQGACHGDSGGPLAANGELVAIASSIGADECASPFPDIYESVYAHLKFINSYINRKK